MILGVYKSKSDQIILVERNQLESARELRELMRCLRMDGKYRCSRQHSTTWHYCDESNTRCSKFKDPLPIMGQQIGQM